MGWIPDTLCDTQDQSRRDKLEHSQNFTPHILCKGRNQVTGIYFRSKLFWFWNPKLRDFKWFISLLKRCGICQESCWFDADLTWFNTTQLRLCVRDTSGQRERVERGAADILLSNLVQNNIPGTKDTPSFKNLEHAGKFLTTIEQSKSFSAVIFKLGSLQVLLYFCVKLLSSPLKSDQSDI